MWNDPWWRSLLHLLFVAMTYEWWGAGMVICLEWGADLHTAQLMPLPLTVSCFEAVKRVCVCVCSNLWTSKFMALEKSGNFFSYFVTTLCVEYVKWVISMCCLCVGLMTVLTYCEVNGVPAILYICYTRSPLSASVTAITAFRQLCKSASLADIIVVSNRQVSLYLYLSLFCLQCFDAVGWAAGRASGL